MPPKVCGAAVKGLAAGNTSVNEILFSALMLGLVTVMVSVVALVVLTATALGEKTFVSTGGEYTIKPALLDAPAVAVWAEVGPEGALTCPPAGLLVLLLTWTVMVQLAPAAREGTVGLICVPFTASAGEKVTPVQVPPAVALDRKVLTKVSVKVTLVNAVAPFRLVSVKVLVEVPPVWIDAGEKPTATLGARSTARLAVLEAEPAVGVCAELTPLAVLGLLPCVELVTVTVTVQLALAASEGTVKLRLVSPTVRAGE